MGPKSIIYLAALFGALLVLAIGGWLVKGAKTLAGRTRQPSVNPRYA